MKTDISGYLDQQDQGAQQENSGRDPKFRIEKAKDPDTEKILEARDSACRDPQLPDGARNLFTYLLDASLDKYRWFVRRGQVAISNRQLRERLCRSARAIYGWTLLLVECRYIWISKLARPNTQPMNVFHITALQPKREDAQLPGDGMWGNGYRRAERPMPVGARGGSGKKRHYLFDRFGQLLFSQTVQNQPAIRKECGSHPQNLRETSAKNDTCHPQNLRESEADFAGATRKKEHLPPAKNDTTPEQKGAVCTESLDVSFRTFETPNSVQRCNAFKKGGENAWLQHVGLVLAKYSLDWTKDELRNSGPWWRSIYRKDADKAARVLAEIDLMIKEGKGFRVNPAACAADLWNRWQ